MWLRRDINVSFNDVRIGYCNSCSWSTAGYIRIAVLCAFCHVFPKRLPLYLPTCIDNQTA